MIGAAGIAAGSAGGAGGTTTLTVGDLQLTLRGGGGGSGISTIGVGGPAYFGTAVFDLSVVPISFAIGNATFVNRGPGSNGSLAAGINGTQSATPSFGSGGASMFGGAGLNLSDPGVGVTAAGAAATGYGAGGGGGHSTGSNGAGGNGSPGMLILEFHEWPTA